MNNSDLTDFLLRNFCKKGVVLSQQQGEIFLSILFTERDPFFVLELEGPHFVMSLIRYRKFFAPFFFLRTAF